MSYLDGTVDGRNTLEARRHSGMLVDLKGYAGLGITGKVGSQAGGPKVWVP